MQNWQQTPIHLMVNNEGLTHFQTAINEVDLVGLDIETAYWWNKDAEKISLIQLALPRPQGMEVWIFDCLAKVELSAVAKLMGDANVCKIIHNANFDVTKLRDLAKIDTTNVYDTMLAARRAGEKGCSLATLAHRHLGVQLDKSWQTSDWSRRPLSEAQLLYAASDAIIALELFYYQQQRGLNGTYESKWSNTPQSTSTPASKASISDTLEVHRTITTEMVITETTNITADLSSAYAPSSGRAAPKLTKAHRALLKIVQQFPGRYGIPLLATLLTQERSGMAGWLVDQDLGKNFLLSYSEARRLVEDLVNNGELLERNQRLVTKPEKVIST
jgi:ribonuclease D